MCGFDSCYPCFIFLQKPSKIKLIGILKKKHPKRFKVVPTVKRKKKTSKLLEKKRSFHPSLSRDKRLSLRLNRRLRFIIRRTRRNRRLNF